MATWNENEYISRATAIAQDFSRTQKPLNDLVEKVAREESLQPDEIRSLGRLTNVETFKELFRLKTGSDKIVEFEVADPESVIKRIVSDAGATEPASANIHNDKLASESVTMEIPDLMREVRQGFKFDVSAQEKVASDDSPSKPPPRHLAKYALENLREEFKVERLVEENAWEAKIADLSKRFRLAEGYGPSFADFEKDAYAAFGSDVVPEMAGLCAELRRDFVLPTQEKVAALTARRVVDTSALELRLLKEAGEARAAFEKYEAGLKWIAAHLQ